MSSVASLALKVLPPPSMISTSDEAAQVVVPPPSKVERDTSFYFDDDPMAVFFVENTLFKVHRHFFIKGSQIFRDMFSAMNANQEGETDEKPIALPDVTRNEFQTLLRFFYSLPSRVLGTGPMVLPGVTELSLDEKLSLLSISHRFLFDDIFQFILQQVRPPSIPVLERIRLGDKYNVAEWLSSAYTALLDRSPGDLSAEEAEALGFERVACLYKAKCYMYKHAENTSGSSQDKLPDCEPPSRLEGPPIFASTFAQSRRNKKALSYFDLTSSPEKKLMSTSEVVGKFFKLK